LVREAYDHFEEAKVIADEGKIQMAISRLQLIKRLLYRVFDQAENGVMSKDDRLKNHLYTLRTFLESLQLEISQQSNPRLNSLLDKSWQLYRKAERSYENGNYANVQGNISLSQRFANKVFRMTRTNNTIQDNDLRAQINETQNLLRLQRDRVQKSNNKAIHKVHDDAGRLLDRARQALDSRKLVTAYQLIQAATRMSARIQRELRDMSRQPDIAALERKYLQVVNALTNLENNQDIAGKSPSILKLMRRFIDEGKASLDDGNYILADEYFNTVLEQINQYLDKWRN
jgi:hypothetical protein